MEFALKFTKLTCVHYTAGDKLGKLLAHASLLAPLAIFFQATKVFCRREVHELIILLGYLATEAITLVLKATLKGPRPLETCAQLGLCASFGMPSSHAAVASFAAITAAAEHIHTVYYSPGQPAARRTISALYVVTVTVAAAACAVSRVYLGYHTLEQVGWGCVLGVALALLVQVVLVRCAGGLRKLVRSSWVAEVLALKDTWEVGDRLAAERQWYLSRTTSGVKED